MCEPYSMCATIPKIQQFHIIRLLNVLLSETHQFISFHCIMEVQDIVQQQQILVGPHSVCFSHLSN